LIKLISDDVKNNIERCNQCIHWEYGDSSVGEFDGCSHPILYDDDGIISDEMNDLIIDAIDHPNQCVLCEKIVDKPKSDTNYRYNFMGDFNAGDFNYSIEVLMPTKYKTPEEAKGDKGSLRFEKQNDHIVLVIYSGWVQGFDENHQWHEHVDGKVLDIIQWSEWWRYKVAKAKVKDAEMPCVIDYSDYIPDATNWDELFDVENRPDNWTCIVESLAYSIIGNF